MLKITGLVVLLSLIVRAPQAYALGEVFKVETAGIEYCGDLNHEGFSANNNIDLFVRIVSPTQLDLDVSPSFQSAVPLIGTNYLASSNKVAFTASQTLSGGGFVTVFGTFTLDASGNVKRGTGRFTQSDLIFSGCFSTGKWKTTLRIQ
jgi:hypothetical protein